MARARNIKPGFFVNEELVELSFATRLLFIGLWTIADRAGRLEDKPKKIKMSIFPADNIDVDAGLNELQDSGFVKRYEHNGTRYIQIISFGKHQNPHKDEKASIIPAPGEHSASTMQDREEHGGNRADSLLLIPDSLNLIPDPLVSDTNVSLVGNAVANCPHQQIIALYEKALPMGTQVRIWNGNRSKTLAARWKEAKERQSLDWWQRFFNYCATSDFLTSKVPPTNGHRQFVVSLDWIINAANFAKIVEGNYHEAEQ